MPGDPDELVSVIIPTRNRRRLLELAVASVLGQAWARLEVIVVDDASTDDTATFLSDLAGRDHRVRGIRLDAAGGGAAARNAGILAARGAYVAFLDDDDVWLPEKLARQVAALQATPEAVAVSCSFYIESASAAPVVKTLHAPADAQEIICSNHLGGASMCLARRRVLLDIGGFDAALRSSQDWDLWIRLHDAGRLLVCPEPLVRYLPHDGARISTNHIAVYTGRRRVFLRYRRRMTPATRGHHLKELLYCRMVQLKAGWFAQALGLWGFLGRVGCDQAPRYGYRYIRQLAAHVATTGQ